MSFTVTSSLSLSVSTVYPYTTTTLFVTVNNTGTDTISVTAVQPTVSPVTGPILFGEVTPGGPNAGTLLSGGQVIAPSGSYVFNLNLQCGGVGPGSYSIGAIVTALDQSTAAQQQVVPTPVTLTVSNAVSNLGQ
jgi:hypothetical protein